MIAGVLPRQSLQRGDSPFLTDANNAGLHPYQSTTGITGVTAEPDLF